MPSPPRRPMHWVCVCRLRIPSWTCPTMGSCTSSYPLPPPSPPLGLPPLGHGSLCAGSRAPSVPGHSTWSALSAWMPCRQLCSWGTLTLRQLPWSQYCLRLAQPWTLPAMLDPTIRTRTASRLHPGGLRIAGVPGMLGEQPRGRTAQLPGRLGVRGLSSAGLAGQQPGPQLRSCRTS